MRFGGTPLWLAFTVAGGRWGHLGSLSVSKARETRRPVRETPSTGSDWSWTCRHKTTAEGGGKSH